MKRKTVSIINRLGLHARAAAKFATQASDYPCAVRVESQGRQVNGKSIMGLMMLAATCGTQVTLETDGEQEAEALSALTTLIANRFGEAE